jgi:hypothetical protein
VLCVVYIMRLYSIPHREKICVCFTKTNQLMMFMKKNWYLNSALFWDVTQRTMVSHRRFGTTYRSHLQASRRRLHLGHIDAWKIGPIRSPETSVRNQPTLCNIPEDDGIQIIRSRSLRSRKSVFIVRD